MTKPVAIVDVDETLWGFNDALRECALSHGYNLPTKEQCTHWGSVYEFVPKPEAIKLFDEVHDHQLDFAPFTDAKEFLEFMHKNFHVIIASHRDPNGLPMLEQWLHIHNLPYDEIFVGFDKTVLFDNPRAVVVVDDRDETLSIAMDRGMVAVGLRRPWNQSHEVDLVLFDNLVDIKRFLEDYHYFPKVEVTNETRAFRSIYLQ
jgi:hypothetical protein